jgi:pyroglutamyl-peptidase
MKKIIVTGFEPFGSYTDNPTQDLVKYLNNKYIDNKDFKVSGLVLPCEYYGAFEILDSHIEKEKPYAIINTGLASAVRGIRIENRFHNIMDGKYPDAKGFEPKKEIIIEGCDDCYYTDYKSNIFFKNNLIKRNLPVEFSNNAEYFICNSLGYLTARKITENRLPIKHMFLYICWTSDYRGKYKINSDKMFLEIISLHTAIDFILRNI